MHVLTTNYSSHTMFKGPCLSPVDMWLQTTTWVHHDRPPLFGVMKAQMQPF